MKLKQEFLILIIIKKIINFQNFTLNGEFVLKEIEEVKLNINRYFYNYKKII